MSNRYLDILQERSELKTKMNKHDKEELYQSLVMMFMMMETPDYLEDVMEKVLHDIVLEDEEHELLVQFAMLCESEEGIHV